MLEVVTKIIPVFLFLVLGYMIKAWNIIEGRDIQGVRKFIITIVIPILLFKVFLDMQLRREYIFVVLISMMFYFVLYWVGRMLVKIRIFDFKLLPCITTGFSLGLLGISLYPLIFGQEHLGSIAVFTIAQELFVWTILISVIKFDLNNERFSIKSIKNIIKSPLIISVFIGLALNLLDIDCFIQSNFILKGIYNTASVFVMMTAPLLLIGIGHSMGVSKAHVKESIKYILLRMVILFVVGYAIKFFLLDKIIQDPYFDYAFFVLLILPPNTILLLVAGEFCEGEQNELAKLY